MSIHRIYSIDKEPIPMIHRHEKINRTFISEKYPISLHPFFLNDRLTTGWITHLVLYHHSYDKEHEKSLIHSKKALSSNFISESKTQHDFDNDAVLMFVLRYIQGFKRSIDLKNPNKITSND